MARKLFQQAPQAQFELAKLLFAKQQRDLALTFAAASLEGLSGREELSDERKEIEAWLQRPK